MSKKISIAIIGTNGIPTKYGGFETLVEYLVKYLSKKFDITVYCSSTSAEEKISNYDGASLKYIPLNANGWQSIPYDIFSILDSFKKFDKILILGASGCLVLPLLKKYKHKFIFLFGGLDWKRSKWNFIAKKFLKLSEKIGLNYSDILISDNIGIQQYVKNNYNLDSDLIEYGGDQTFSIKPNLKFLNKYPFLKSDYNLCVARIQKDNNIEMILNSIDETLIVPLVIIGNWTFSKYGSDLKKRFSNKKNIILLDAIYEKNELNVLRSNCSIYIHGHSCGGTNPALVEAMFLKIPIFAHSNIFNKETTHHSALYFKNDIDLNFLLNNTPTEELNNISKKMHYIANNNYKWDIIIDKYERIFKG